MKEIDVVMIGDIAWNQDITPTGDKISPGGAAYYSAVGAARFSKHVGVVAKIGNDFQLNYLTNKHIDIEGVKTENIGNTCRFVITQYPDNTRDFTADRGVAQTADVTILPDTYKRARYIHLPTQLPEHALTWLDVLQFHTNVSVDSFEQFVTDFPELTVLMFRKAATIFTNETEIEMLHQFGEKVFDKPLIVKQGKKGAAYIHNGEAISIPAPNVTPVDTTGAGDVLAGAFLALRAQGASIEKALEQAVQTASLSVTTFGVEHIIE